MTRSRDNGDNKDCEELKIRNCGAWLLGEFQGTSKRPRVSNTLGLRLSRTENPNTLGIRVESQST
jgi:glucose-6-phosphate dehydrogenase assembly protein OpcA